jgi:hypothetical protein
VTLTILGLLPVARFLFFYLSGDGAGHVQSVLLGGVLILMGFMAYLAGLVADLISFNRQLLEMALERIRRMELAQCHPAREARGDPQDPSGQ